METTAIKKSSLIIQRMIDNEALTQADKQLLLALANDPLFCQKFALHQACADQFQGIASSMATVDLYEWVAHALGNLANFMAEKHEDFEHKILDVCYKKPDAWASLKKQS